MEYHVRLVRRILKIAYVSVCSIRIKKIYYLFRATKFAFRDQTCNRGDRSDDTPDQRKKLKYVANNRRDWEKKDREIGMVKHRKARIHSTQYTKPRFQKKDDARRRYD